MTANNTTHNNVAGEMIGLIFCTLRLAIIISQLEEDCWHDSVCVRQLIVLSVAGTTRDERSCGLSRSTGMTRVSTPA